MTPTPTIIPERVEKVRSIIPETGAHSAPPNGTPVGCEVELLSWAAGMPWSDSTPCISPVVAAFLRRWNDDMDKEGRANLHAFCVDHIEQITATGGDGRDEERAWVATDWLVRVHTPAWLELAGITDCAATLRGLPPLTAETVKAAQPSIWATAWAAAWAALNPTTLSLQDSARELLGRMVATEEDPNANGTGLVLVEGPRDTAPLEAPCPCPEER